MRTREQFLSERATGIGGSDAAKVLGISPYGGPLSVFMDKTGRNAETEMNEAIEMGIELEDTVARVFTRRTGLKVARINKLMRHPDYPWMIANIDRRIVGENKGLECKTAHFMKGKQWDDDELPSEYFCQVQHYMSVMGWSTCWIAALIGGQRFKYKEVIRNDEFIAAMIDAEREFWHEYVLKDIAPIAIWCDDINSMFPRDDEAELLPASGDDFSLLGKLLNLQQESQGLGREIDGLKNQLRQRIGAHSGIDGIATWKRNKDATETDWKAIAYELGVSNELINKHTETRPGARVLRLKKLMKNEEAA